MIRYRAAHLQLPHSGMSRGRIPESRRSEGHAALEHRARVEADVHARQVARSVAGEEGDELADIVRLDVGIGIACMTGNTAMASSRVGFSRSGRKAR